MASSNSVAEILDKLNGLSESFDGVIILYCAVKLLGVCAVGRPMCLLFEYMAQVSTYTLFIYYILNTMHVYEIF
jgi:hypothetical protein